MKHVTSYIFLIIAFLLLGVNGAAAQEKDCPFKVAVVGDNTDISYDNKVLSIRSSDKVTITGDGSLTDWGIEIESRGRLVVTIKDLNIEREGVPLKIKRRVNFSIIIEGTNRFVSKGSSGTAGIEVESSISLRGGGSLTAIGANGDGDAPGGAGIGGDGGSLIIQGGIIHAKGGAGAPGIGVSDPKKDMTIQIFGGTVTAIGKNPAPGIDGGASSNYPSIAGNAFVIAIDEVYENGGGRTTQIKNHTKGLFIRGEKKSDGSIVWDSSALVGDVTLESNAEIPDWAEVTIADGQTFTIADGITLENNGTLTNNGAFTNNGTLSGTVVGEGTLNIGGKDGFDVFNTDGGATFSYDGTKEVLTISGSGGVLIRGRNKDNAVGCGIVIEQDAKISLTLEDLNIKAAEALVYKGRSDGTSTAYLFTLQGTNRLTSTGGPGINIYNTNDITFVGTGSLTVTGGSGCAGIEASSFWLYKESNVFVVAIGGEGAASGISGHFNHHSGLLIHGSQNGGGNFSQKYSKLVGSDFTLGGDAEIPDGAEVTIAKDQTFTIDAGVTLTNNGTIENNGIIRNKGTLKGNSVGGNGKLYYVITFDANYSASPVPVEKDFLQSEMLPTNIFTRSGYTFQGWYDAPSGGTNVETVTEPQTLYARWKAVPVPEPDPEPAPTIYYTVTLPFLEGAVTDPVAGDYDVESWSTFRFYLTLDSAYSESQPVVTTSRGETLQPRTSDGAYLLKYVRTDVEVYIDGIEKNNPVANEPIRAATPEPEIWSEDACLCIRLLDSFRSTTWLNRRQLPTGIYIVQVGATVRKVAIR